MQTKRRAKNMDRIDLKILTEDLKQTAATLKTDLGTLGTVQFDDVQQIL